MDETFPKMFRQRALRDAGRRALTFEERTWTYAEVVANVEALAAGLSRLGVRHGDRVLYAGLNHAHLAFAQLATMDLGAVFAPVDPRLAPPERAHVLDDLRPSVAIVDEVILAEYVESAAGLVVISADGDGADSVRALLETEPLGFKPAPARRTDLAMILYTSGTTGLPKGVMHSHEMILANGLNLARLLGVERTDIGLVHTPMFHTAGINTNLVNLWAYGGEVVLLPKMNGQATLEAIARYKVTRLDTVTAALNVLYHTPGFRETDLSTIRTLHVGGAIIPIEQVSVFAAHGAKIMMAAGMTECTVHSALAPEKLQEKPDSVGVPLALVERCLVSQATGAIIEEPGVIGEICLRGPSVTSGYWNNHVATGAAFDAAGWFHTGDLAKCDADGDLYLVARIKDVIKTGGESVAAVEVERVIIQHPSVEAVAVIGEPHERWGETIVAAICLKPEMSLEFEELRDFCAQQLARFKLPTRMVILKELPLTASGKVAKHKLDLAGKAVEATAGS